MGTLFISDLHLVSNNPILLHRFLSFMERETQADALYILGDFFDAYLGNDDPSCLYQEVIDSIKKWTTKGTPVYLMSGNHDFLLNQNFANACGASLLEDPCVGELYGKRCVLTHGDILFTQDKTYQNFRSIIRRPLLQKIFLSLPIVIRQHIAAFLQKRSQAKTYHPRKKDINKISAHELLAQFEAHTLIHGHTHQTITETFSYQNETYTRYSLGSWKEKGHALEITPTLEVSHLFFE